MVLLRTPWAWVYIISYILEVLNLDIHFSEVTLIIHGKLSDIRRLYYEKKNQS